MSAALQPRAGKAAFAPLSTRRPFCDGFALGNRQRLLVGRNVAPWGRVVAAAAAGGHGPRAGAGPVVGGPQASNTSKQDAFIRVAPGDTLASLAKAFGVSRATFVECNKDLISSENVIFEGDLLHVPGWTGKAPPGLEGRIVIRGSSQATNSFAGVGTALHLFPSYISLGTPSTTLPAGAVGWLILAGITTVVLGVAGKVAASLLPGKKDKAVRKEVVRDMLGEEVGFKSYATPGMPASLQGPYTGFVQAPDNLPSKTMQASILSAANPSAVSPPQAPVLKTVRVLKPPPTPVLTPEISSAAAYASGLTADANTEAATVKTAFKMETPGVVDPEPIEEIAPPVVVSRSPPAVVPRSVPRELSPPNTTAPVTFAALKAKESMAAAEKARQLQEQKRKVEQERRRQEEEKKREEEETRPQELVMQQQKAANLAAEAAAEEAAKANSVSVTAVATASVAPPTISPIVADTKTSLHSGVTVPLAPAPAVPAAASSVVVKPAPVTVEAPAKKAGWSLRDVIFGKDTSTTTFTFGAVSSEVEVKEAPRHEVVQEGNSENGSAKSGNTPDSSRTWGPYTLSWSEDNGPGVRVKPEQSKLESELPPVRRGSTPAQEAIKAALPALALGLGAVSSISYGWQGAMEAIGLTFVGSFIGYELLWADQREQLLDELKKIRSPEDVTQFLEKRGISPKL